MKMCIYYYKEEGNKMMRGYVQGHTEDECLEKAFKEFGKDNIYGYCKA